MMKIRFILFLLACLGCSFFCSAQKKDNATLRMAGVDSVTAKNGTPDSTRKKKHDPHKATMHSLILPGWGQAYNRKYWKIPIVYAALGITGFIFNFNRLQYNKVKFAYFAVVNRGTADSALFPVGAVSPELKKFVDANDSYSLQLYRTEYRKDIDYSVLFFLFFWALNVVDATVDGHLKDFDVSDDLSLKIKPSFYNLPTTPLGVSFVFNIGKQPVHKSLPVIP
ncbi:MAG: DUF5683 domain-containing protein [Bacteroidota bacterium]